MLNIFLFIITLYIYIYIYIYILLTIFFIIFIRKFTILKIDTFFEIDKYNLIFQEYLFEFFTL